MGTILDSLNVRHNVLVEIRGRRHSHTNFQDQMGTILGNVNVQLGILDDNRGKSHSHKVLERLEDEDVFR